jgi:hypothetical protein
MFLEGRGYCILYSIGTGRKNPYEELLPMLSYVSANAE